MHRAYPSHRRLTRAAGIAAVAFNLLASPAFADDASTADISAARSLFEEAVAHAQAGRWEQARDRYRRSLELHDDPVTRYSLAVANLELGHLVAARDGLVAYLQQTDGDASSEELRGAAQRAVAAVEPRIPTLEVIISPSDVDPLVLVDGETVDARHVELDPGDHWIEVTADGYARVTEDVSLVEGQDRRVAVALAPVGTLTAPTTSSPPPSASEPSTFPTGPVVLMASGGAVGLTGLGVGLAAVARASGKTSDDPSMPSIRRQAIAGDVLGVLGATTAAAGLVWWLASDDDAPGDTSDAPRVSFGVAPTAAHLQLRF